MFCHPDDNEPTAPSRYQEKSSILTTKGSLNFQESPVGKFEININECVIEVEAKTQKGDQSI